MRKIWAIAFLICSAPLIGLAADELPDLSPNELEKLRTELQKKLAAEKASHPAIARLSESLGKLFKDNYPDALIDLKQSDLSAQTAVQKFMIHTVFKTGEIAPDAHEEIGPSAKGFILKISVQPGRYDGAAVLPQTFRNPYWQTFANTYALSDKEYIHLHLSYGIRISDDFIEKVKQAVAAAAKN